MLVTIQFRITRLPICFKDVQTKIYKKRILLPDKQ